MYIEKLVVKNYKILKDVIVNFNEDMNIFVGDNDAGKSTLLEALSIALSGKINGARLSSQIKVGMFNNETRKEFRQKCAEKTVTELPEIYIEAYFDHDPKLTSYRGTNNSLAEDIPGVRVQIAFDRDYEKMYKEMFKSGEVRDIPIEFYHVVIKTFSGQEVYYPRFLMCSIFIDTTRKDYSYALDHFINTSISTYLTVEQCAELEKEYRQGRASFSDSSVIKTLNAALSINNSLNMGELSVDLKEVDMDEWMHQVSIILDEIPFENLSFGIQNVVKIKLALQQMVDHAEVLLLEEPENNLSYASMQELVAQISQKTQQKQVFLSTHSSYIVNKLNLKNLQLVRAGEVQSFQALPADTQSYFVRLPGYDTLRVVLAHKIILVEGPTDELIIQRAYKDQYNHLPIEDGIDVFAINGLSFKRYCDIALLINKKLIIATDNDQNIQENINDKYKDYLSHNNIKIFYEKNEVLHTIEPSVLAVNCIVNEPTDIFLKAIGYSKYKDCSRQAVEKYMTNNKSLWAERVFESEDNIIYPEYILQVIEEARK